MQLRNPKTGSKPHKVQDVPANRDSDGDFAHDFSLDEDPDDDCTNSHYYNDVEPLNLSQETEITLHSYAE